MATGFSPWSGRHRARRQSQHNLRVPERTRIPIRDLANVPCRCDSSAFWVSQEESCPVRRRWLCCLVLSRFIGSDSGLYLITAFSAGLAMVLVTIGLVMVYAKRVMSARLRPAGNAVRFLPFVSSAFMAMLGVGIAVSAVASIQFGQGFFSRDKLVPFATVVLLGLFLGMRHSTDADHVVAVSTIVSRQGSVRSSATIGLLWGLGHTVTIFLVGSAIIVFGVVIPPRLGLSMEFSVALMLILLGLLNLTGVMRWITERLTPAKRVTVTPAG